MEKTFHLLAIDNLNVSLVTFVGTVFVFPVLLGRMVVLLVRQGKHVKDRVLQDTIVLRPPQHPQRIYVEVSKFIVLRAHQLPGMWMWATTRMSRIQYSHVRLSHLVLQVPIALRMDCGIF